MTKQELILKYLQDGGELTPMGASKYPFYSMYLSSYIKILRKQGYPIKDRREDGKNFNIYYLDKKEEKSL